MSAALPTSDPCCIEACDDVLVQNIPGPAGEDGSAGTNGTNGVSAVTTINNVGGFNMPAEGATDTITVVSTAGMVIGQNVFVQGLGTLEVTAINSAITATLKNVENTALMYYTSNAIPGANAALGSRVGMTGLQGPAGLLGGAAAGSDIKGTYPLSVKLAIPNVLGALVVGNGTDAVSLSPTTAGYIPVDDVATFPATRIGHKKVLPVTGDADVGSDRIARLSAATGLPIPLESSKASLKDPGGAGLLVADASAGNPRGTDAVDLQVNRATTGVTGVASGVQSVILGGQDNKASGVRSAVVGGQLNLAVGTESFIGSGEANVADSTQSAIVGGDTNSISGGTANEAFIGGGRLNAITGPGQSVIGGGEGNTVDSRQSSIAGGDTNSISGGAAIESFIGGGRLNAITGSGQAVIGGGEENEVDSTHSTIAGGDTNSISGGLANESFIGGGATNAITGNGQAVIAGGAGNIVTSQYGSVLGGGSNTVSGFTGSIAGGSEALSDKYGQRAFAGGRFAAKGDAQQSDLIWRISTAAGAGATEMFLDGNALRATISTGRTVAFDILITARGSGGLNAAWTVKGVINNLAGTTSIATAVVTALIADNSGATFGTLANVPVVAASDATDSLTITVVNTAGATTVRWVAHGRLVEIGY